MDENEGTTRIIEALAGEAEFVEAGGFSVDVLQAGAKLQSFRLAQPEAWIVLLVEAATLVKAKAVFFSFGSERVEAWIPGLVLSAAELGALGVLFGSHRDQGDPRTDALRVLGLAFQALRSRKPAELELLGGAGSRLQGETLEACPIADGWFCLRVDFDADIRAERAILRERSAHAQIDVFIDEEQVAMGWRGAFGVPASARDLSTRPEPEVLRIAGRVAGLSGFHFEHVRGATLLLLIHGVLIERIELDGPASLQRGFVAVVEAPHLGRDLGLSKAIRDEDFDALVAFVEAEWERMSTQHAAALELATTRLRKRTKATKSRVIRVAVTLVVLAAIAALALL